MYRNLYFAVITTIFSATFTFAAPSPRTIDGSKRDVPIKHHNDLLAHGRQTVLFVEDPAGLGPPSPDEYWSAVLDSILGTSNYGWFGPTVDQAEDGPDLATMQGYELVIWNCYDCWDPNYGPALTATDQTNIASYLSGGGKVWLIGQDILYSDVPFSWMQTHFNLQSAIEDYGGGFPDSIPFPVKGTDELSGYGFNFLVDWASDVFPDDLAPNTGAHVVIQDSVNSAHPAILSADWSSSFWTIDGRNPDPWLDWQEMVHTMLDGFGVLGIEAQCGNTLSPFDFSISTSNPAMSKVTICCITNDKCHATLRIYDSSGRPVKTLLNTHLAAGRSSVHWDCMDESHTPVSSGCYFCVLSADERSVTKKIVLIR